MTCSSCSPAHRSDDKYVQRMQGVSDTLASVLGDHQAVEAVAVTHFRPQDSVDSAVHRVTECVAPVPGSRSIALSDAAGPSFVA